MSEPVTQAQFFDRMQQIEDKMQDYHRRQRDHIDAQTLKLELALATHETADQLVANRVLMIETERGIEKQVAAKHGVIAGSIGAGVVVGVVESVKRWLGHP